MYYNRKEDDTIDILDEGITIAENAKSLDFKGNWVAASSSERHVTAEISGDGGSAENISYNNNVSWLDSNNVQDVIDELNFKQNNIGVVQLPTVIKNVDGTITVGDDGIVNLCETADGRGNIKQFSNIIGDTLTPINNAINFLYADYNSGSPVYKISTTNQIFLTDNTLAPVVRISRYGTRLHFEEYDEYGTLTANKLVLKDVILNGARRLNGLTLSTEATRKSIVSAGQGIFSLQYYLNLEENRAGTAGYLYELYPTAGVWSENLVTEYDSSYYSDGTNRIALDNNKYVSKYFWRDIGDDNEVYYIHGQQYNTESQAFNENVPVAPFFMTGHSVYVGKIVIQKNSLNGIAYPRNWEGSIQSATVSNHNDLSGIQGGTANEYYHLTYFQSIDLTDGGISALHKHTLLSTPDGTSNFVYTDNSGTLHIDGDIIQNGSSYETHAEQVYTKKDLIITRDGAISGLGVGEYTGFQAKLYDGVNDGMLVFDKDGIARVGDVGALQALATRQDTPIDTGISYWNNSTSRFDTSSQLTWDNTNRILNIKNTAGTDVELVLDRNANANWKFLSNSGNLMIQSDYTSTKVAYYDVLKLFYNTGNATLKGKLSSAGLNDSTLTASQLVGTDSSKNLVSLSTATYPSLTELSYLKGVTSSIQTQLNGKEPTLTAGTSSQYYRGDKTWQTLNTTAVTEGTNLYYTDTRARLALSSSATGLTYTNSTGVFSLTSGYSIPTTANQTNWTTAYTNRITSLTTTGSSGAATLSSNTLNIPNYTLAGLGGLALTGGTLTGDLTISKAGPTINLTNSAYATNTTINWTNDANQNCKLIHEISDSLIPAPGQALIFSDTSSTANPLHIQLLSGGNFYTGTNRVLHVGDLLTSGSTSVGILKYNGTTAAAGNFYGGTTTPTGSTRLNYSGYFYPTYINLTGSGDTTTAATHYFVETGSDGYVRPKTLANVKAEIVTTAAVNAAAATTVGNVTSGTWNATKIGIAYGGTNSTSFTSRQVMFYDGTSMVGDTGLVFETRKTLTLNDGLDNVSIGTNVSLNNSSARYEVMIGTNAGRGSASYVRTGFNNIGIGNGVLQNLRTTASRNTCVGTSSGQLLLTNNNNCFFGYQTGRSQTGDYNIHIGTNLGRLDSHSGSNVLYIGHGFTPTKDESNVIRIANVNTNAYTSCYIQGIYGQTSASGVAVLINSSDKLGTTTSSIRYKENVVDMADYSSSILNLRPVMFDYKDKYDDEGNLLEVDKHQPGLIAEEVAEIMPELVVYDTVKERYEIDDIDPQGNTSTRIIEVDKMDENGNYIMQPETVRYLNLIPLMLNEIKKLREEVEELKSK